MSAPHICPACGSPFIRRFGVGTEQVEQKFREIFPRARVLRMDNDTTRGKDDLTRILTAFRRGEAQVLVGTQMVAKGHDFPGVTLVGVIMADMTLNLPDYRSEERTFQLLTQVAGRAGRGRAPGENGAARAQPGRGTAAAGWRGRAPGGKGLFRAHTGRVAGGAGARRKRGRAGRRRERGAKRGPNPAGRRRARPFGRRAPGERGASGAFRRARGGPGRGAGRQRPREMPRGV